MSDSVVDLRRFLDRWIRAEERGDVTTLRRLLGNDFFVVQPDGSISDKHEWLQRYRLAVLVHEHLRLSIVSLVEHPHVAVAVAVARLFQISSRAGRAMSGTQRVTIVVDLEPPPHLLCLVFTGVAE